MDTNVLVSGLLDVRGVPGQILKLMLVDIFVVLYDDRILHEYIEVLARPKFAFMRQEIDSILDYVVLDGEQVATEILDVLLPDPTDVPFLEVAVAGHADALVTGNVRDFRPKRGHHAVNICSPADLLRRAV